LVLSAASASGAVAFAPWLPSLLNVRTRDNATGAQRDRTSGDAQLVNARRNAIAQNLMTSDLIDENEESFKFAICMVFIDMITLLLCLFMLPKT
tara:strand:- start:32599 stop:32880 length:282 start_codon:yes stop_codon:yes gene_type:complete